MMYIPANCDLSSIRQHSSQNVIFSTEMNLIIFLITSKSKCLGCLGRRASLALLAERFRLAMFGTGPSSRKSLMASSTTWPAPLKKFEVAAALAWTN